MRDLIMDEVSKVSGGELECTIGSGGASCTGTMEEWGDALFGAYDDAVSSFTDFFEWVDEVFSEDSE